MPSTATQQHPVTGAVLTFTEDDHRYVASGEGGEHDLVSVTTFVKHYFPGFDADTHAARIAERDGKSPDAVKAEWRAKGDAASRLGTRVHEVAEDCVLGRAPRHTPESERERALMAAVWEHVEGMRADGWTFLAAEQMVFDESLHLAGTIDLPAIDPEGAMWLLDWKTNERIDFESRYNQTGLGPCRYIDHCNWIHYALQLTTYAKVITFGGWSDQWPCLGLLHVTGDGVRQIDIAPESSVVDRMLVDMLATRWYVPF